MGDHFIFQIIANNSGIRLNVNIVLLQDPKADFWIVPIIQGFVQIEELVVNYSESSDDEKSSPETPSQEHCVDDIYPRFIVAIISRRSRHRAGMETITFEGQDVQMLHITVTSSFHLYGGSILRFTRVFHPRHCLSSSSHRCCLTL